MDNIQTAALRVEAFKKNDILAFLEDAYKSGEALPKDILAMIYKTLEPNITATKDPLAWVSRALKNVPKNKPFFKHIYQDDRYAIATDAFLMLAVKRQSDAIGYIDKKGNRIDHDWSFPDYTKIIPETNKTVAINRKYLTIKQVSANSSVYVIPTDSGELVFYRDQLDIALNGEDNFIIKYDDRYKRVGSVIIETPFSLKHDGFILLMTVNL